MELTAHRMVGAVGTKMTTPRNGAALSFFEWAAATFMSMP